METLRQEAVAYPAASYFIRRVKTKIASGEYQTEAVRCFCGSDQVTPVTDKDRYGFDYRMGLCRACGIMYANPRLAPASSQAFYRDEYRKIYDGPSETPANVFADGEQQGLSLKHWLEQYEITPKVVFDIGCNSGSWLKVFDDAGATVYGVDYDETAVAYAEQHGLPVVVGGVEQLEALGLKADLIILNHTVEHFLDLEAELTRIRALLSPEGMLYVGVPGLYSYDLRTLFQNAHTYQFTAETLAYVMECCGFEEFYLNEQIQSLWMLRPELRSREDRPTDQYETIWHYLFGNRMKIPMIRSTSRFPVKKRREQLRGVMSLGIPDMDPLMGAVFPSVPAVIIGGGPSVDAEVEAIRTMKASGAKIICIERMLSWCLSHDLMPDYVVALDASDDVIESFGTIPPEPTYLMAAQCPMALAERLKPYRTYLFQTKQHGIPQQDYWKEQGYETVSFINAGGSVTLCAMSIAMALGMKTLHVFGFDCHVTQRSYAPGITGVGEQKDVIEVEIGDRRFTTRPDYLSYAQQFFHLRDLGLKLGHLESVTVHGDSLVAAMSLTPIGPETMA